MSINSTTKSNIWKLNVLKIVDFIGWIGQLNLGTKMLVNLLIWDDGNKINDLRLFSNYGSYCSNESALL